MSIAHPTDSVTAEIARMRPRTPEALHGLIERSMGFRVPVEPRVAGHQSPFSYLAHTFFEDTPGPRDCIVWANRGGGKTQLGAIATLLDLAFKPGIQIRILAGSFEQASRMYLALSTLLRGDPWRDMVVGDITQRRTRLMNGSAVEVLSQSERSIRGQRVHKLRCDEVELFDDDLWNAAQMVTRSGWCGDTFVKGTIEALSTMHRPFGLMQRLLDDARDKPQARSVFRWNVIDQLETCPPARACEACPLVGDCGGSAKRGFGHITIDDAIAQLDRTGADTWHSEMLCTRPSTRDLVYPEFDIAVHVQQFDDAPFRAAPERYTWLGGVDFGYRSPTVVLWAVLDAREDMLYIVDSYSAVERTTEMHIAAVNARPWPRPKWIGADPAGLQRQENSGSSTISTWRHHGFAVRAISRPIRTGVEAVRTRLRSARGTVRLIIHERCTELTRALAMYHFDPDRPDDPAPVKDGPDHAADALRYLVVPLDVSRGTIARRAY